MANYEIGQIRNFTLELFPEVDFDSSFTFFYDETNNPRKVYVQENDLNTSFTSNFVLGGVVFCNKRPNDLNTLISGLKLQPSINELKFKHIAKGDFLDCLKSKRLNYFLNYVFNSDLYLHLSSLNILYWSIVDIVDSAIMNSPAARELGLPFANALKSDLYKLCRIEFDSIVKIFHHFQYPNIKKDDIFSFIESLTSLFTDYLDDNEYHFGLESLRQILKEAKKNNHLPFIEDEDDFILLGDFTEFYLRPIYLFENSNHIFDIEETIQDKINALNITCNGNKINNFKFEDSKNELLIQVSDVCIGLIGKFTNYINCTSKDDLQSIKSILSDLQEKNLKLIFNLINKSLNKNKGFLHSVESYDDKLKMEILRNNL